ncbi:transcription factor PIF3-like [Miscanthus floridulus]|uniref:transcription factor PIF3-like n=1 Tax=Miscanthus floridulus TaxID=154761 RepID=UPI003459C8D2
MEVQPTTSLRLLSPSPVALPPSEDDMAAWLYPIVSGQEHAVVAGHDDHQQPSDDAAGLAAVDDAPADHNRERPPNMEEKCHSGAEDSTENYYSCGSRKKATGGARSHSHPEETHNLTEKRRRRKINEKLKTLRQLVPGCDDKAMSSFGCGGMKPPAVVVPPPYPPAGTGSVAAGGLPLPPAASRPCSSGAGDGERARRPAARGGSCTSTTSGDGTFRGLASTGASFTHTILLLLRS